MYFRKNFGSTSKADLEVLLFSEYIEHCIREKECFDDYTLSKELGITQARVRTLKERKELKYPHEDFNWQESFAEEIKNAKYDEHDRYIRLIVQDVNVMNEVRHYIEMRGWFDECSLNKKLLKIPLDCFAEVFLEKDDDFYKRLSPEDRKKLDDLGKSEPEVKKLLADFTKDGVKSFLMSASKTVIPEVLSLLPFGGFVRVAFDGLTSVIQKM